MKRYEGDFTVAIKTSRHNNQCHLQLPQTCADPKSCAGLCCSVAHVTVLMLLFSEPPTPALVGPTQPPVGGGGVQFIAEVKNEWRYTSTVHRTAIAYLLNYVLTY